MSRWETWRRMARSHPGAADAVLACAVFGMSLVASFADPNGEFVVSAPTVALGALLCGVLSLRRRAPLAVLAIAGCGAAILIVMTGARTPYTVVVAVAAYTVASTADRQTAWTSGVVTAAVLTVTAIVVTHGAWPQNLAFLAWTLMATAVGDALRTRRAYIAAIEERARRAEQSREEEAARRVAEERLRIARELHDVVAHHIALINVQAGVAGHFLRSEPDTAMGALGHVRLASRTALDELATLLGVLRQSGDPDVPTEPAPGLGHLHELLDRFAAAGLHVALATTGRPAPLPAVADLAAYRIIQEALTNVRKHAPGAAARVHVTYGADTVTIEVRNGAGSVPSADGHAPGGGHGVDGMRERAESLGGTFTVGPLPSGGFQVTAEIPLPERTDRERDPSAAR